MAGSEPIAPLEPVSLRRLWPDEARDFTPWLAKPENLARLGATLGLGPLEFEDREAPVGPFSIDILARDPLGHRVVIENQLEPSDHDHLGKALTYVAGVPEGFTVVWVAAAIRAQHRAALDWLNGHTPSHINFFAVEIGVWTINGSGPGTLFNVVVRPATFARLRRRSLEATPQTEEQLQLQDYWAAFRDFLEQRGMQHWIKSDLPRGGWWGVNLGKKGYNIYAIARPRPGTLGVTLEIDRQDDALEVLKAERAAIETEIGVPLTWGSPGVRYQISTERAGVSLADVNTWPEQHEWLLDRLERFRKALKDRIAALPTGSIDPADGDGR